MLTFINTDDALFEMRILVRKTSANTMSKFSIFVRQINKEKQLWENLKHFYCFEENKYHVKDQEKCEITTK